MGRQWRTQLHLVINPFATNSENVFVAVSSGVQNTEGTSRAFAVVSAATSRLDDTEQRDLSPDAVGFAIDAACYSSRNCFDQIIPQRQHQQRENTTTEIENGSNSE